ncbi:hypothetical protein GGR56DRAFT_674423 [Xylariaceae sp. FL0804]|nr:hypothetical protein GGR56DRAFT_674423 [Xylariaceae sp. FL0804]
MCYIQNIHICVHHALISVSGTERNRHECEYGYPPVADDHCPLHSCCFVQREVITPCAGHGAGRACPAWGEDVFVPMHEARVMSARLDHRTGKLMIWATGGDDPNYYKNEGVLFDSHAHGSGTSGPAAQESQTTLAEDQSVRAEGSRPYATVDSHASSEDLAADTAAMESD